MTGDRDLTSMTVSLPAAQRDYVREQASAAHCTPSDFIQRLIHADRKAREQEQLERSILEGLDSPARPLTAADWNELRASVKASLGNRLSAR